MDKAKILFLYPEANNLVEEIIDLNESLGTDNLTASELPCHVAVIRADGRLEEALATVSYGSGNKYAGRRTKVITIDVLTLQVAENWADKQIGEIYSLASCAEAEIYALTGKVINHASVGTDCSQFGTNYLRFAGLQLEGFIPAQLIRPSDLFTELVRIGGTIL